jgi:hypothetical protein
MCPWLKRGLAVVALVGVLVASNLHLAVIQGVAWVRMYEQYRVGYSPAVALQATFSGQAPCHLCKFVQTADRMQQKFDRLLSWSAKILLPVQIAGLPLTPLEQSSGRLAEAVVPLASRVARPELPPPRCA